MRCAPCSTPLRVPLPAAALAVCAALAALSPSEARAAAEEGAPVEAPPALRRAGFLLGLSGGLALGSAKGYPNDVAKIDLPEFEAGTGLGANNGATLWIGGSLADWFNVAVGFQRVSFAGNGLEAAGGNLNIRLEAFPLFYRGGAWQDLGLTFTAGTGGVTLRRDGESVAEGEGTSAVGFGAFYEPFRFWQLSTGPDLIYTHQFSRSMTAHLLVVGWRLAFYGGP